MQHVQKVRYLLGSRGEELERKEDIARALGSVHFVDDLHVDERDASSQNSLVQGK